ncbi:MAPEG family protein [Halomonas sp. M4R1S46]|uniref:MAPEG family protein n=1 Tax=Halomonas sp. M4R1S46 TaxID=2982692 RepID=UPI0021E509ED|nr:MAPEG family protein [Halomonas sp. M4R1S46]UYG08679.1 MAPEG family protein [Halomonas sp. M4R1S46]
MPLILQVLFVVSLLPILLAWIGALYRVRQLGRLDNHHPRAQQARLTGVGARVNAAQANAWESLAVFAAVCVIAVGSGLDLEGLDGAAWLFLACRLLHPLLYAANLAWWRSGVYAAGMAACLYIVWRAASQGTGSTVVLLG